MTGNFLDMLFGCWHKSLSFPISSRRSAHRSAAASLTGTYVVCLDCGREFPYDWQEMRILEEPAIHGEALPHEAAESYASK
jgi:hypothetical protein